MTINNLIDIFFLVIVLIFVISQIRSSSQGNKPSKRLLSSMLLSLLFPSSPHVKFLMKLEILN